MSPALNAHTDENRVREDICTIGRSIFERGLKPGRPNR
jgi:hypothetical protein